jgi:prolyl-tRNA synthetase
MSHSDDNGLVLPPKLAPIQVVIVPIFRKPEQLEAITKKVKSITEALESKGITVKYDDRDTYKPGYKFAEWELKGVPVRLAIGPRDLENNTVEVARRDTLEKETLQVEDIGEKVAHLLEKIQDNIYQKALDHRDENSFKADSWEEFREMIEKGGFVYAHWDGTADTEQNIKEETKATIRVIPFKGKLEEGKCVYSGKPSKQRVVFAKAY